MSSVQCWRGAAGGPSSSGPAVLDPKSVPCGVSSSSSSAGEHFSCCTTGNSCLEGGICHWTHAWDGSQGYKVASCTDPTLQDSVCNLHCANESLPYVTYDATRRVFACCTINGNGPDCEHPTNQTWSSPPPQELQVLTSLASTATSGPSTTTSSASTDMSPQPTTTTTLSTPPAPSAGSGGLDIGAKAGIGVGVGMGFPIIVLLLVILLKLMQRDRGDQSSRLGYSAKSEETVFKERDHVHHASTWSKFEAGGHIRQELPIQSPTELHSRPFQELPMQPPTELQSRPSLELPVR